MYRNWFWLPIVIGALSSYYLLRSSPGTPGAGYLEVKSVVIGDVVPSSQHRVNVVMTNCGSSRLTGLHAMPSCGCIRVDGLPEQLGAGEQAILTIEIETPSTPGDFKKSVRILSEFHQRDMKISGRVLDILRTEPTRLFIETRSDVDDLIGDSVRVVTKFPETIRWTMKSDEFSVERQGSGPDWVRLKIVGRPTSATGRTQITIADDSRPEGKDIVERENMPRADDKEFVSAYAFGSAHPSGWQSARCDGSVHLKSYDLDDEVHRRLGNRADGGVELR